MSACLYDTLKRLLLSVYNMNKNKIKSKSNCEGYGGHSGSNFISFADVITPTSSISHHNGTTATATSNDRDVLLTPIYRGNDVELAVSCKHMMKKDITTKLKSLKEVMTLLQDRPHVIHDFLPYFIYVFPRLYLDNDRKIREQLFALLMTIVILDKQSLTLYMKHLIGYWYIGTADPCVEVSDMAISALEKAIPPKKREPVLLYLSTPLLKQIRYYLDQKPETLSDMNVTTQDDALERYERIYISTTSCSLESEWRGGEQKKWKKWNLTCLYIEICRLQITPVCFCLLQSYQLSSPSTAGRARRPRSTTLGSSS